MNHRDRVSIGRLIDDINALVSAPKVMNNHITDADVVEAILIDLDSISRGSTAHQVLGLVVRDRESRK